MFSGKFYAKIVALILEFLSNFLGKLKVRMEYGREVKKGLIMFLTKLKDKETKKRVTSLQSNMNKDRGKNILDTS
jgi:hypothetical protein